jgi:hypothetical protein
VRSAHSTPSASDREKDIGPFSNEIRLHFRRDRQIAEALFLMRQSRENPATDTEIGGTHVGSLFGTLEAQRDAAKVCGGHGLIAD